MPRLRNAAEKAQSMGFKRPAGRGGIAETWIDKNLPRCPLCKSPSHWETATEVDEVGLGRWHFRCPECMAIISTPPELTVSAMVRRVTVMRKSVTKYLRFESVGKNKIGDLVGKEYPLAELQEWAKGKPG